MNPASLVRNKYYIDVLSLKIIVLFNLSIKIFLCMYNYITVKLKNTNLMKIIYIIK